MRIVYLFPLLFLAACQGAGRPCDGMDFSQSQSVEGRVVSAAVQENRTANTAAKAATGSAIGVGVGALAGGNRWAHVGAAVTGAVIGSTIQGEVGFPRSVRYTILTSNKKTMQVEQPLDDGETPLLKGEQIIIHRANTTTCVLPKL